MSSDDRWKVSSVDEEIKRAKNRPMCYSADNVILELTPQQRPDWRQPERYKRKTTKEKNHLSQRRHISDSTKFRGQRQKDQDERGEHTVAAID
jgi:hypothetical protein